MSNNQILNRGDFVKMSTVCKQTLIENDCSEHVDEFGECIGLVEGLVNYNNEGENNPDKFGPEVDVRWYPSGLRYGYDPERDLIKVTADPKELYVSRLLDEKRRKDADIKIYMMCEGNKGLLMGTSILPLAPDIGEYIEVNDLRISKKVFEYEYKEIQNSFNRVLEKIKDYKKS